MATQKYPLLCLENPLLDILGNGDQKLLEKYKLKLDDTLLAEPHQMGIYEDLLKNHKAQVAAGGGAQNTARGAQYMLPENSVMYIGCVGDDEYANMLRESCKREGVHVEYRVDPEHPTGRCGVVITDHHRTMCTDLAAANHYKLDHLKQPHVWALAEASDIYYVGGYHLTVCVPAAMALAEHAAQTNKVFMIGMAAGFIPQFFKDQLAQILPYCDYVFGNENEAKTWVASQDLPESTSIPECAKLIAKSAKVNKRRPRTVIITQGTEPTIVAIAEEGKEVQMKEYPVLPIDGKLINDTTGAGDAFAGGFCAGVVAGDDLETTVKKGQWLAKLSLEELGASYPFPKKAYPN